MTQSGLSKTLRTSVAHLILHYGPSPVRLRREKCVTFLTVMGGAAAVFELRVYCAHRSRRLWFLSTGVDCRVNRLRGVPRKNLLPGQKKAYSGAGGSQPVYVNMPPVQLDDFLADRQS